MKLPFFFFLLIVPSVFAIAPVEVEVNASATEGPEVAEERSKDPAHPNRALSNVGASTLTISWPENFRAGDALPAVMICPGGGYARLAIDREGHDVARWLNKNGYIAAVLKYRLPDPVNPLEPPLPTADGLAGMKILRERAEEWGIRKDAIGIMGCSAGGHLASTVATRASLEKDSAASRPDFQILLYPVITLKDGPTLHPGSRRNLLGEAPDASRIDMYSNDGRVGKNTPPAFIVHAMDDKGVPIENSRRYIAALSKAGVPCELVELTTGGHGFALGTDGGEPAKWPPLCLEWLKKQTTPKD
jgi:acetyl esterase/lipase